jgi:hypothetical protein
VTAAAELAQTLGGRRGGTGYIARCPAHDDRNPSLSITDGDGGKLLLHCHAGCSQEAVIDALRNLGLWAGKSSGDTQRTPAAPRHSHPLITPPTSKTSVPPRIVSTYDYTDQRGDLLYQIVRYDPKDFRQRYPSDDGGWIWKKHPTQVLYRLHEVREAPIAFVVEGEKDADTLREYGFVGTTKAGGAASPWLDEYTEILRDKDVLVVSDNDSREKGFPGQKAAVRIFEALKGVARRVRLIAFQLGIRDITDWFAAGHSETELIYMLERS